MKKSCAVFIFLLTFIIASCASTGKHAAVPTNRNALTPTETYFIMKEGPNTLMELVTNDAAAGNTLLRQSSLDADINDPVLDYLAARMLETVKKAPGVGIAAPQVGILRRMIWVQRMDKPEKPFELFYNPEIVSYSEEKADGWEGCLSVPAGFGKVDRAKKITLTYDTKDRGKVTEVIEGFTAVIFQHEIDHLNGVLFIDKKIPGDLMPKEQYYDMRKKEKEAKEKEAEKSSGQQ